MVVRQRAQHLISADAPALVDRVQKLRLDPEDAHVSRRLAQGHRKRPGRLPIEESPGPYLEREQRPEALGVIDARDVLADETIDRGTIEEAALASARPDDVLIEQRAPRPTQPRAHRHRETHFL